MLGLGLGLGSHLRGCEAARRRRAGVVVAPSRVGAQPQRDPVPCWLGLGLGLGRG